MPYIKVEPDGKAGPCIAYSENANAEDVDAEAACHGYEVNWATDPTQLPYLYFGDNGAYFVLAAPIEPKSVPAG